MTMADSAKRFGTTPASAILPSDVPERDGSPPPDRARLLQATAEARLALEQAALAVAIAAQRARSVATALDAVLAVLVASEATAAGPPANGGWRHTVALSPREQEVLALVAEGRSNKAIAETLFVSPNTVKSHVASLLSKLHADTRAQLAVIAARHELPFGHDEDGFWLRTERHTRSARPFLRS